MIKLETDLKKIYKKFIILKKEGNQYKIIYNPYGIKKGKYIHNVSPGSVLIENNEYKVTKY